VPSSRTFYVFTWGRAPRSGIAQGQGRVAVIVTHGQGETRDRGKKGVGPRGNKAGKAAKVLASKPARAEKSRLIPDNPFAAALMGLKDNK